MKTKSEMLRKRSELLRGIRAFFYARDVIEVDTPMLSQAATPDLHLASLATQVMLPGLGQQTMYLHTSPEYPMKRLLCEGSGDIFYLGKVFRDGDLSPRHQIEFTMLEWYRLGFTMQDLIDEVSVLINEFLPSSRSVEQLTYQQAYAKYAGLENVFTASAMELKDCLQKHQVAEVIGVADDDKALWQQLILTEVVEPKLGQGIISIITHFPAADAALAKLAENGKTALRFEVFVDGMELANGYDELADAVQYGDRFAESNQQRAANDLPLMPLDHNLLASLTKNPLPACSGVALGVDRLFMLQQGVQDINHAVPFGGEQA